MGASEYKRPVLGLNFLKYISGGFEELHAQLAADRESETEDGDEYTAHNVLRRAAGKVEQAKAILPDGGTPGDQELSF